jgi:heat shock protein HtpX
MWNLRLRAYVAGVVVFALFFALFYLILVIFVPVTGGPFSASSDLWWLSWLTIACLGLDVLVVFAQFWFSVRIIHWSMKVRWLAANEQPELQQMVTELAQAAGVPRPQVGVSEVPEPNAFAFGRWATDGRVCVTSPLLELLDAEELRAVLAHEISHLRHRDMIFMTLLQIVPLVAYTIARSLTHVRGKGAGQAAIVAAFAFLVYLVSTLLVLYVSRLREAYADRGSVDLTHGKAPLASALLRITHETAGFDRKEIKQVGGTRALLVADPYRAGADERSFAWGSVAPQDRISEAGLQEFDHEVTRLSWHLRLAEVLSTHPILEHRLKLLAELPGAPAPDLTHPSFMARVTRPRKAIHPAPLPIG